MQTIKEELKKNNYHQSEIEDYKEIFTNFDPHYLDKT